MNLDFAFLSWETLRAYVISGLVLSVTLTLVAMVGGIALGTVLALMRLSCKKALDLPAAIYVDTLRSVLLTQTIILFQDTSLVYAIGAYDLLKGFESVGRNFNRPVETCLLAALLYFAICFSLSTRVRQLQKMIAIIR